MLSKTDKADLAIRDLENKCSWIHARVFGMGVYYGAKSRKAFTNSKCFNTNIEDVNRAMDVLLANVNNHWDTLNTKHKEKVDKLKKKGNKK